MISSAGKDLASYPCTAGSRALVGHLHDHGKAVYTSPYEDGLARSAMHAAAHEARAACDAAGHPHRSPAPAGTGPAGDSKRQPPERPATITSGVRQLDRSGRPVTFASVASAAGISGSWLYTRARHTRPGPAAPQHHSRSRQLPFGWVHATKGGADDPAGICHT